MMTKAEARAVERLRRALEAMPASLVLVQHADSPHLSVKRIDEVDDDDPSAGRSVAYVRARIICTT